MELTDEQWSVVEPLIPNRRRLDGKGRPRVEARRVLDGILWVLWTGAPWSALPSDYPPYQTCHRRMQEWVRERVFVKILRALAEDLRDHGKIDLTEGFVDGTHAGAKRGALSSGLHDVDLQQRSWQWRTAMVCWRATRSAHVDHARPVGRYHGRIYDAAMVDAVRAGRADQDSATAREALTAFSTGGRNRRE
jgi:transposase